MSREAAGHVRFLLVLAGFGALVALIFREEIVGPALVPVRELAARVTLDLVEAVGLEGTREAAALYHPGGFAYVISRGCLGLVPAGFLAVGILAYPGSRRGRKLISVVVGVAVVGLLNLARLVHLYYLGVHQPELFLLFHRVLWQVFIVAAVVALWLIGTEGVCPVTAPPARRGSSASRL